ncbi:hypothetical protein AB0E08_08030 [Streptomyces sp. NPDC048281]|uniref:hypothetical protein n=1 Tax=Streptomyces sp. NPDC048281 TaxID=3154715 RepID=UPI003415E040
MAYDHLWLNLDVLSQGRHRIEKPLPQPFSFATDGFNEQLVATAKTLDSLRSDLNSFRVIFEMLSGRTDDMQRALRVPGEELSLAKHEVVRLERENASLIREAKRQATRADAAEAKLAELRRNQK